MAEIPLDEHSAAGTVSEKAGARIRTVKILGGGRIDENSDYHRP
jgi:hypothetical protein